MLLWPALLNGYPLVFSDTGAFLGQTVSGAVVWDKPLVYGPLLAAFHWQRSLWPAAVAHALLLSWLLWLAQRAWRGAAGAGAHLLVVAVLAGGTAAPWVASLLMPDVLTPALVLAIALLGFAGDRLRPAERIVLLALATLATAAHLSHLPLAAALALLVAVVRRAWRPTLEVAAPLLLALALLLATNIAVFGRLALSPFGSVFVLARLAADGPAARTLAARCAERPPPPWRLCAWAGRLPADSDEFLWRPGGPAWSDPGTPALLAPEAAEIVAATLAREPVAVLLDALSNTASQSVRFRVGDTLGSDWLEVTVGRRLAEGFPPAEQERFATARQANDSLREAAAPFLLPHLAIVLLGTAGLLATLARVRDPRRLGLALAVPVALLVNAAATGALSKPHHRYQARLIWLLPLIGLTALPAASRWLPR